MIRVLVRSILLYGYFIHMLLQAEYEGTAWCALELAITAHFFPDGISGDNEVKLTYTTLGASPASGNFCLKVSSVRQWYAGESWASFKLDNRTVFVCPPGHPVVDLVIRSDGSLYFIRLKFAVAVLPTRLDIRFPGYGKKSSYHLCSKSTRMPLLWIPTALRCWISTSARRDWLNASQLDRAASQVMPTTFI